MSYFREVEFKCKCGKCFLGFNQMNTFFLAKLYKSREVAGIPFILTSAVRCKSHNQRIGGTMNSAHLTGQAVDIQATHPMTRMRIVSALIEAGFNRIGIAKDFIHVDDDESKTKDTLWLY